MKSPSAILRHMAFTASTNGLLERLEKFAAAHLETNWVAEPKPARLALLVREELRRWTQSSYPGVSCEGAALPFWLNCPPASHREGGAYNGRRGALFGCVKPPFPRRALPPPQRHIDVFNPLVMTAFALAIGAMVLFVWHRLQQF